MKKMILYILLGWFILVSVFSVIAVIRFSQIDQRIDNFMKLQTEFNTNQNTINNNFFKMINKLK